MIENQNLDDIIFLTIDNILDIHRGLIMKYGGSHGLRDQGLLESALNMPFATFDGKFLHDNIYDMASAYAFHIIKNHPFVDGNKRTGATSAIIFFEINGIEIDMSNEELRFLAIKIATSEISKEEIAEILRKHAIKN